MTDIFKYRASLPILNNKYVYTVLSETDINLISGQVYHTADKEKYPLFLSYLEALDTEYNNSNYQTHTAEITDKLKSDYEKALPELKESLAFDFNKVLNLLLVLPRVLEDKLIPNSYNDNLIKELLYIQVFVKYNLVNLQINEFTRLFWKFIENKNERGIADIDENNLLNLIYRQSVPLYPDFYTPTDRKDLDKTTSATNTNRYVVYDVRQTTGPVKYHSEETDKYDINKSLPHLNAVITDINNLPDHELRDIWLKVIREIEKTSSPDLIIYHQSDLSRQLTGLVNQLLTLTQDYLDKRFENYLNEIMNNSFQRVLDDLKKSEIFEKLNEYLYLTNDTAQNLITDLSNRVKSNELIISNLYNRYTFNTSILLENIQNLRLQIKKNTDKLDEIAETILNTPVTIDNLPKLLELLNQHKDLVSQKESIILVIPEDILYQLGDIQTDNLHIPETELNKLKEVCTFNNQKYLSKQQVFEDLDTQVKTFTADVVDKIKSGAWILDNLSNQEEYTNYNDIEYQDPHNRISIDTYDTMKELGRIADKTVYNNRLSGLDKSTAAIDKVLDKIARVRDKITEYKDIITNYPQTIQDIIDNAVDSFLDQLHVLDASNMLSLLDGKASELIDKLGIDKAKQVWDIARDVIMSCNQTANLPEIPDIKSYYSDIVNQAADSVNNTFSQPVEQLKDIAAKPAEILSTYAPGQRNISNFTKIDISVLR